MFFQPHQSPIPRQGRDLVKYCETYARHFGGMPAKNLDKLLTPYAFGSQTNNYGREFDSAAESCPALLEGVRASRANSKAAICTFIRPLPRCYDVARQLNSSLDDAAEIIFDACFPQKINFIALKQLSEHAEVMDWFANNRNVPDEHFENAYRARLPQRIAAAEEERNHIAAAALLADEEEAAQIQAAAAVEAERTRADAAEHDRDRAVAAFEAERTRANFLQEQLNVAQQMIEVMLSGASALFGGLVKMG